jgi:hypothetical protein
MRKPFAAGSALLVVLVAAASASANPNDQGYSRPAPGGSDVAMVGCFVSGGAVTVPSGTPFTVFAGWGAARIGQIEDVLHGSTNTLSIDGGTPIDMSPYFRGLTSAWSPGAPWADIFFYQLPALAPGESVSVAYFEATSHPTVDGVTGFPGPPQPAGSFTFTCTVTGSS